MPGPAKGRGGRPPKPTEQKRRTGNPGKRELKVLAPVASIRAAVAEITAEEAVARVLDHGYWLSESDSPTVALLRDAVQDYARIRSVEGMPAKEIRDARAEVARLAADCGFNPSERARLGLAEVTARSKLDEIQQRRRASGD